MTSVECKPGCFSHYYDVTLPFAQTKSKRTLLAQYLCPSMQPWARPERERETRKSICTRLYVNAFLSLLRDCIIVQIHYDCPLFPFERARRDATEWHPFLTPVPALLSTCSLQYAQAETLAAGYRGRDWQFVVSRGRTRSRLFPLFAAVEIYQAHAAGHARTHARAMNEQAS